MSEDMPPQEQGSHEGRPLSDEDMTTHRIDPWGLDVHTNMPPQTTVQPGVPRQDILALGDDTSDDW
jgi:hypothetical protein